MATSPFSRRFKAGLARARHTLAESFLDTSMKTDGSYSKLRGKAS